MSGSGSGSSYNNKAQGTAMLDMLRQIGSMYTDKYLTLGSSQGIYTAQQQKLQATLNSIKKQINEKDDAVNTYDRELQDRKMFQKPFTFWRLRGVSTLQDWVLFIFFIIYACITLFLILLSLRSQYPLYGITVVLLSAVSLAVVIMGTIVRYA